jgi:predicted transcriptional regulator
MRTVTRQNIGIMKSESAQGEALHKGKSYYKIKGQVHLYIKVSPKTLK